MARTKNPSAASKKSWITRKRGLKANRPLMNMKPNSSATRARMVKKKVRPLRKLSGRSNVRGLLPGWAKKARVARKAAKAGKAAKLAAMGGDIGIMNLRLPRKKGETAYGFKAAQRRRADRVAARRAGRELSDFLNPSFGRRLKPNEIRAGSRRVNRGRLMLPTLDWQEFAKVLKKRG